MEMDVNKHIRKFIILKIRQIEMEKTKTLVRSINTHKKEQFFRKKIIKVCNKRHVP